jgi:hypothetical protein
MPNAQSVDQNYWTRVILYLDSMHEAGNICSRLFQCVVDEYESLHWWSIFKQDRLLGAMKVLNSAELYLLKRLVEEADEAIH